MSTRLNGRGRVGAARDPRNRRGWPLDKIQRTVAVVGLAVVVSAAAPRILSGQSYTLDDWMTVSSVGSFLWSPDGRFIYFTSNAAPSGTREIFRIPSGGGNQVLLTQSPAGVRPEPSQELTLSPDGETIFFTSARYFQTYLNLFRMPAGGGPAEALTFNDAVIQTSPSVSPDGRTLAYFARTRRGAKIYTMDLSEDPRWARLLFPGEGEERSPAWSSLGDIAFSRGGQIWVLEAGRSEPRVIVEEAYRGGNGAHVWSPDGGRIAFTRGESGFAQIGVVEVRSGIVTPITQEPNEHGGVSWSPDGRWLVFVRNDDRGMSQGVVIARSDGSGRPRILSRGKGMRSSPNFSPDGTRVAFLESTSTRTQDIWVVPVEGGPPGQLTRSMGRIDPASLAEAEEVFYRGPDNLRIPAMLWRPPDFDPSL